MTEIKADSPTFESLMPIVEMTGVAVDNETSLYESKSPNFCSILRFQNGRLVNHRMVNDPILESKQIGAPYPNIALRFGLIPTYTTLTATCLLFFVRRMQNQDRGIPNG